MVKYHFDPEPIIECSCRAGFILDENDRRRCHGEGWIYVFHFTFRSIALINPHLSLCVDIDECEVLDHGCEQICNNLPGSYECACHPGLRTEPENMKKCVGKFVNPRPLPLNRRERKKSSRKKSSSRIKSCEKICRICTTFNLKWRDL